MKQQDNNSDPQNEVPEGHIAVDKDPTPDEEGGFFSTADEKRQAMLNQHELAIHDRNLGLIGKVTGSTNASLNVAAIIIAALLVALMICLIGSAFLTENKFGSYVERLIAAILTVAGFVFGVRQAGSKD